MSICIVGSGLAGLAAAIKCNLEAPSSDILIVSNSLRCNSRLAGQRYWTRLPGRFPARPALLAAPLALRNGGSLTAPMLKFATLAIEEINFWKNFRPADHGLEMDPIIWHEKIQWFGPQLGRTNSEGAGIGSSVVNWFDDFCDKLGIRRINATVTQINRCCDKVQSLTATCGEEQIEIKADHYVLAGGSVGGSMFESTNLGISNSPQELAWNAGLQLRGAETFMMHIFGRLGSNGDMACGCYETDLLNRASIYLNNPITGDFDSLDERTSQLLATNQAHHYFDEIAERFHRAGGTIKIIQDGKEKYARIAHHYSHLGVSTDESTHVLGMENLYAIGDAAGTTLWTNGKARLPGMALVNCLVGAKQVAAVMQPSRRSVQIRSVACAPMVLAQDNTLIDTLRAINSAHLRRYHYDRADADIWLSRLREFSRGVTNKSLLSLIELSICTAYACLRKLEGNPIKHIDARLLSELHVQCT